MWNISQNSLDHSTQKPAKPLPIIVDLGERLKLVKTEPGATNKSKYPPYQRLILYITAASLHMERCQTET